MKDTFTKEEFIAMTEKYKDWRLNLKAGDWFLYFETPHFDVKGIPAQIVEITNSCMPSRVCRNKYGCKGTISFRTKPEGMIHRDFCFGYGNYNTLIPMYQPKQKLFIFLKKGVNND